MINTITDLHTAIKHAKVFQIYYQSLEIGGDVFYLCKYCKVNH